MSDEQHGRTRTAILWIGVLADLGIVTELVLIGHWKEPMMLVPLVVALVSLVVAAAVTAFPCRPTTFGARGWAAAVTVACWWGVVEHLTSNAEFAQELHPDWSTIQLLWSSLRGGVPALAPLSAALPAILVAIVAAPVAHGSTATTTTSP